MQINTFITQFNFIQTQARVKHHNPQYCTFNLISSLRKYIDHQPDIENYDV
jgi:hypothetical protein